MSPGPDGFTVEFFKYYCDKIKEELVDAFNEFHSRPVLPNGINAAFITLIPKISNPTSVKDFRPISLISSVYKVLAKVLANRLKRVLPILIEKSQSAFVENRQITDGPLIVNEVIDWAKAKKKKIFIFKLDIAKAHDTVSWNYPDSMMDQKGFGAKWTRWVKVCLSLGTSSVLVNASPSEEFPLSRGLCQGDPLSPFLFMLVTEGLHNAIVKAEEDGTYKGSRWGTIESLSLTSSLLMIPCI